MDYKQFIAKNFEEIFDRIIETTETETIEELAEVLNVKQDIITTFQQKRYIPPSWFIKLSLKYKASIDWLFYGIGEEYLYDFNSNLNYQKIKINRHGGVEMVCVGSGIVQSVGNNHIIGFTTSIKSFFKGQR